MPIKKCPACSPCNSQESGRFFLSRQDAANLQDLFLGGHAALDVVTEFDGIEFWVMTVMTFPGLEIDRRDFNELL